jgi:hypothetical protein
LEITLCFAPNFGAGFSRFWGSKLDTCTSGLRESDGNRLLCVPGAVFALAHVKHLFSHEFARLCARGFSFFPVPPGSFDRRFLGHGLSRNISPKEWKKAVASGITLLSKEVLPGERSNSLEYRV